MQNNLWDLYFLELQGKWLSVCKDVVKVARCLKGSWENWQFPLGGGGEESAFCPADLFMHTDFRKRYPISFLSTAAQQCDGSDIDMESSTEMANDSDKGD